MLNGLRLTYLRLYLISVSYTHLALANAELDPKTLADKAGVTKNIVYTARRGCYVKPIYLGKIAKALGVDVESLINIPFSTYDE